MWRVLTQEEWYYLFTEREDATNKYGLATINGVNGLILLPDNWNIPQGINFKPSSEYLSTPLVIESTSEDLFQTENSYTLAQWGEMERHGAVFLPAAGGRLGSTVGRSESIGNYWSSTIANDVQAYGLLFSNDKIIPNNPLYRRQARSVRLVQDVE